MVTDLAELAEISYTSRAIANFVSNFVAMATGVGRRKCNWQHPMAHPRKTPIGAQIFYASRVIAKFVPNFVVPNLFVMATVVNRR